MSRQRIAIIVGGGFGGLNAAKALAGKRDVFVTLIDRRNHHLFQPLLYQVATAGLNPADIAVPIRAQFSGEENVEVHLARAEAVDLKRKVLISEAGEMHFEFLVLACGAQHSYFGHGDWEPHAPGLKTLEQATEIRRRILSAFEQAENESDPEIQRALMTFVVVGGGPTGVELAGAIADISRTVLVQDFRRIDPTQAKVVLIEAGSKVLATFGDMLSAHTKRDLEALGVEVRVGSRVEEITSDGVRVGPLFIGARNVFWAAGVQATKLRFEPAVELDRAGRVKVGKDFSIPGHPDVFVIGDMASFEVSPGQHLPGLAPVAIQAGRYVGKTILASIRGKPRRPFHYVDKGQMATIGKHRAVALSGHFRITGYLAWLAWLFVHVFYLIGFKNRVAVLVQWAWSYLFSKRGSRLITERDWKLH